MPWSAPTARGASSVADISASPAREASPRAAVAARSGPYTTGQIATPRPAKFTLVQSLVNGCFRCWWQVQGSNLGRLSRRFYIPEEAGRGQVAGMSVFWAFPAGFWACREEGRGPGGAPGWANDLDAGPASGSHWTGRKWVWGMWVACPCAVLCPWRACGCVNPFGGARGWWPRGHGAGSRAGSGINQTRRPPAGGGGQ